MDYDGHTQGVSARNLKREVEKHKRRVRSWTASCQQLHAEMSSTLCALLRKFCGRCVGDVGIAENSSEVAYKP